MVCNMVLYGVLADGDTALYVGSLQDALALANMVRRESPQAIICLDRYLVKGTDKDAFLAALNHTSGWAMTSTCVQRWDPLEPIAAV
jgi:hypothetical protein